MLRQSKAEISKNNSSYTVETFRGTDPGYFEEELSKGENLKGFEKKRVIEKFLSNDEIFYKFLSFVQPLTMSKASDTTVKKRIDTMNKSKESIQTVENKRYMNLEALNEEIVHTSPPTINNTTHNNNFNFYINTQP